jgi:hypothetical protein
MSPPRSTAPGDWAPSRAAPNVGPYGIGGLQSPASVVGIFKDSSPRYGVCNRWRHDPDGLKGLDEPGTVVLGAVGANLPVVERRPRLGARRISERHNAVGGRDSLETSSYRRMKKTKLA